MNGCDMITLIKGGTFFGDIVAYDWRGKFLVVDVGEEDKIPHKRIIHWDNVESVSIHDGGPD